MHTFFHGWRRKAGCVTLVMALAMMGAWFRSLILCDAIVVQSGTRWVDAIVSDAGHLMWADVCDDSPAPFIQWKQFPAAKFRDQESIEWHKLGLSFAIGEFRSPKTAAGRIWSAPYCALVIPLTLLSAYLLLWKPRKRVNQDA
jgi:hypothetical protein